MSVSLSGINVDKLKWLGLICSVLSACLLTYLKTKSVFDEGNVAQTIVWAVITTWLAGLVLGLISIRTWQGIISTIVCLLAGYFLFFTRLYWLS
jgi:hypothetical protein